MDCLVQVVAPRDPVEELHGLLVELRGLVLVHDPELELVPVQAHAPARVTVLAQVLDLEQAHVLVREIVPVQAADPVQASDLRKAI